MPNLILHPARELTIISDTNPTVLSKATVLEYWDAVTFLHLEGNKLKLPMLVRYCLSEKEYRLQNSLKHSQDPIHELISSLEQKYEKKAVGSVVRFSRITITEYKDKQDIPPIKKVVHKEFQQYKINHLFTEETLCNFFDNHKVNLITGSRRYNANYWAPLFPIDKIPYNRIKVIVE